MLNAVAADGEALFFMDGFSVSCGAKPQLFVVWAGRWKCRGELTESCDD